MTKEPDFNPVHFEQNFFKSEQQISCIGKGSFGGKAKGLVLMHDLLNDFDHAKYSGIDIKVPKSVLICTEIFDAFIRDNKLDDIVNGNHTDEDIAKAFHEAKFSDEFLQQLQIIVEHIKKPLAVRSSSLLEDNIDEPFSGIYCTKMLPNNQDDINERLHNLESAIKHIYASTFFKSAKDYMKASKHVAKDEKMGIIIQEVTGNHVNGSFYPQISGIAKSYNYYATGKAKPKDGIINLALGLGKSIVDGGISWAFSPAYPAINPPFGSTWDMLHQTQTHFWAINTEKQEVRNPLHEDEYLIKRSLSDAEKDGNLKYLVSTYDSASDSVSSGIGKKGARILTFAPILVDKEIKLNELIKELLKICEHKLNAPVEIEFALSFSENGENDIQCEFGFLQVRPLSVTSKRVDVDDKELHGENVLAASDNVLGNGVIKNIKDIVYINPDTFDLKLTREMASEIEQINKKLVSEKRPYLLIGFGRWGSSDSSSGIPAKWGQVSGAKVIIEATLENIYVEMSQGSQFFQNLTSMKVCYFSIPFAGDFMIDWDWLAVQKLVEESRLVNHVTLEKPLRIKVDGRSSKGVIYKE